ncbi:group III truncated hemoglobin [Pedobacter sp. SYP-B3415]|uniref:group III truncated hemoglobin n=1 Tax=Pedobacter sp. SYP-B3415 TaxID=2496641 RepID=UPI00101BFA92|nr:group III truncated hemoglobin [Pedobacter sp. SYP-B3415]
MRDIENIDDIRTLVDTFYGRVQQDDLIGPIFNGKISDWSVHLAKMYRFWQTVLLDEYTYTGRPFPPHANLPVDQAHFDRWLGLWSDTVNGLFSGAKAREALWRAEKMAVMFLSKIDYYRDRGSIPLI